MGAASAMHNPNYILLIDCIAAAFVAFDLARVLKTGRTASRILPILDPRRYLLVIRE